MSLVLGITFGNGIIKTEVKLIRMMLKGREQNSPTN